MGRHKRSRYASCFRKQENSTVAVHNNALLAHVILILNFRYLTQVHCGYCGWSCDVVQERRATSRISRKFHAIAGRDGQDRKFGSIDLGRRVAIGERIAQPTDPILYCFPSGSCVRDRRLGGVFLRKDVQRRKVGKLLKKIK